MFPELSFCITSLLVEHNFVSEQRETLTWPKEKHEIIQIIGRMSDMDSMFYRTPSLFHWCTCTLMVFPNFYINFDWLKNTEKKSSNYETMEKVVFFKDFWLFFSGILTNVLAIHFYRTDFIDLCKTAI